MANAKNLPKNHKCARNKPAFFNKILYKEEIFSMWKKALDKFRNVFSAQHAVLPVIHVESREQALHNAQIAKKSGCNGIFMINHHISFTALIRNYFAVRETFPDLWIGLNCLDLAPQELFRLVASGNVAGIWTDNAMIDEGRSFQEQAEEILLIRSSKGWKGLYFGGVAFKYQPAVHQLDRATKVAAKYMDVVTTSGPATGQPADVEKIRVMKEALGDFPLAIASGITPDNVSQYLPLADAFLVATGISKNFTELDPYLTKKLVDKVRSWERR